MATVDNLYPSISQLPPHDVLALFQTIRKMRRTLSIPPPKKQKEKPAPKSKSKLITSAATVDLMTPEQALELLKTLSR
jgi:hypothetical protein